MWVYQYLTSGARAIENDLPFYEVNFYFTVLAVYIVNIAITYVDIWQ